MMNFCTLFDSFYLSRGLLLYESLKRNSSEFHLFIFAFDNLTKDILLKLNLEFTTIITSGQFENEDLLKVKPTRNKAEYCWTSTSSVIKYVLDKYNVEYCIYLDADLYFYDDPQSLIDELTDDKTVLITEHRYSFLSRYYEQKRAGRFCVQFILFSNDDASRKILDKWISQCLEWCYARYEDGKFGDQKYLDTWPGDYSNVHILENMGGGVAPWNAGQFRFFKEGKKVIGVEKKSGIKFNVVFFHFHYIRISDGNTADLGWNPLGKDTIEIFYKPYIEEIISKENELKISFPEYKIPITISKPVCLKDRIKYIYKKITRFNLLKISE